jgi:hypothetical protein
MKIIKLCKGILFTGNCISPLMGILSCFSHHLLLYDKGRLLYDKGRADKTKLDLSLFSVMKKVFKQVRTL